MSRPLDLMALTVADALADHRDSLRAACRACRCATWVPLKSERNGLHWPADTRIVDLIARLRCRRCRRPPEPGSIELTGQRYAAGYAAGFSYGRPLPAPGKRP